MSTDLYCSVRTDFMDLIVNPGFCIDIYDYREYMTIFSVVFQDFKIFAFSIAQNVAASLDYDKAKVESCLVKAGFGERLTFSADRKVITKNVDTEYDTTYNIVRRYSKCRSGINY